MTDSTETTSSSTTDCPQPPRRLFADRVLRNKPECNHAWDSRRANKMRERFTATGDTQPMPTLSLIAPVQPSLVNPSLSHRNQF